MNPGYLSLILGLIALILLACGWTNILLQGVSQRAVYLFFLIWIVSFFIHLSAGSVVVTGTYVLWAGVVAVGLYRMKNPLDRLHVLSLSLMLGSTLYLMQRLSVVSPALTAKHPIMHSVVVLTLAAVFMQRKALPQIAMITSALLFTDTLDHLGGLHGMRMKLGGVEVQDEWWQAVWGARLGSVLVEAGLSRLRLIAGHIKDRRKEGEEP